MFSDLIDLLKLFARYEVKYMVVGGFALMQYTEPRYTRDCDLWVEPTVDNAEKVYRALEEFGAPLDVVTADDFTKPNLVYQMGRDPLRIDILTSIDGVAFSDAERNAVQHQRDGYHFNVIGYNDLLKNKKASGRPQDLLDVTSLETRCKDES